MENSCPKPRLNPSSATPKVYLPGLHGLRFLAAFSVFFGHLEQAKDWLNYGELLGIPFTKSLPLAADGVTLFFVLSGFLITHLLLTERTLTGTIKVRQFYLRRILRIWPLYYLFVFISFVVLPGISALHFPKLDMPLTNSFWERFALYWLMSPHISNLLFPHPGVAGPLWSVGVEEYFYAVWPHVIKRLNGELPWGLVAVIALPICFRSKELTVYFHWSGYFRKFFELARFDCMAIGGAAAWIYFNRSDWAQFIFRREVQVAAWLLAVLHRYYPSNHGRYDFYGQFDNTMDSLVFAAIIMNVGLNPRSLVTLENRFFRFMGEISYGFYVFHWLAIVICMNLLTYWGGISNSQLRNVLLLGSTFALTTAFASLSYYAWERRFLRLKAQHATIDAGLAARDSSSAAPR